MATSARRHHPPPFHPPPRRRLSGCRQFKTAAARTAAAGLLPPWRRWMAGDQAAPRRWSAAQIWTSMAGSGRGEAGERRWWRWRGGTLRERRGPDGGGGSGGGKAAGRARWQGRCGGCSCEVVSPCVGERGAPAQQGGGAPFSGEDGGAEPAGVTGRRQGEGGGGGVEVPTVARLSCTRAAGGATKLGNDDALQFLYKHHSEVEAAVSLGR
uniref:Uncharacterized protein n=1 Tax=Oryza glumipatula TaxID=40148 RepID=A0A0D9Y7X5_9ORYZ